MRKSEAKQIDLFCDRFEVVETYTGGMANVLVCRDVQNNRIVAAKTPNFAPELFSREARMWLGLGQHPNIVKAHIVHNIGSTPYLFMDFIGAKNDKSQNFRQSLALTSNRLNLILNVGIGVINALKYARSIYPGFVHRDIKPENILIDSNENVYLSDFGIGHIPRLGLFEKQTVNKLQNVTGLTFYTKTGSFIGTLGYASPEQYFDSSIVSFKSDIYSLGVVLFEAIYSTLPYDPKLIAENGYTYLQKPIEFKSKLPDESEAATSDIVSKMLDFSAKFRPASLDILKRDFEKLKTKYQLPGSSNKDNDNLIIKNDNERTYVNRIYSFIELEELDLAATNITRFQKEFPLSLSAKTIVHKLFLKMPDELSWKFLRKVAINDISNPKWIAVSTFGLVLITGPFIFLSAKTNLAASFIISSIFLLIVLKIEKYINARTSITLDKITLPGIAVGYFISFMLGIFNLQAPAGSIGKSIAGSLIGLIIPLLFAWLYNILTGKNAVGGGTIKLAAMIGSWTGLMIIPILVVALILLILQGFFLALIIALPGELKWNQDTLVPRLLKRIKIAVPTSMAFFYSTWLLLVYSGIKVVNYKFLSDLDWLIVRFLP